MRALRCLDGNGRQAQWTVFRRRSRRSGGRLEAVDLLHDHEDHERNDDEIEHGLQKDTVVDGGRPSGFGRGQRGLRGPRQIEEEAGKVDFA